MFAALTLGSVIATDPAEAGPARDAFKAQRALTWHYQDATFYPRSPMKAHGSVYCQPRPGCRWHRAVQWARDARHWRGVRTWLAHPTIAACWAMVDRAFKGTAYLATARYVIDRESGCAWWADNPTSTALGVAQ